MEVSDEFDGIENRADPVMVFLVLGTVKGFAEGKVPDDVEGGEVVPSHQIDFPSLRTVDLLMEFVD